MCSCDSSGKGMCVCSSGYTGKYCETKVSFFLYLEHLGYLAMLYMHIKVTFTEG